MQMLLQTLTVPGILSGRKSGPRSSAVTQKPELRERGGSGLPGYQDAARLRPTLLDVGEEQPLAQQLTCSSDQDSARLTPNPRLRGYGFPFHLSARSCLPGRTRLRSPSNVSGNINVFPLCARQQSFPLRSCHLNRCWDVVFVIPVYGEEAERGSHTASLGGRSLSGDHA